MEFFRPTQGERKGNDKRQATTTTTSTTTKWLTNDDGSKHSATIFAHSMVAYVNELRIAAAAIKPKKSNLIAKRFPF